jgi:hypothetical protein
MNASTRPSDRPSLPATRYRLLKTLAAANRVGVDAEFFLAKRALSVCARIAEIVLRDERAVVPIGVYNSKLGVTLSLPGVVGRNGCLQILDPPLSNDERLGLKKCVETLRKAQERIR